VSRRGKVVDSRQLLNRFLGEERTIDILSYYERLSQQNLAKLEIADEELSRLAETHLAGGGGGYSAEIVLN